MKKKRILTLIAGIVSSLLCVAYVAFNVKPIMSNFMGMLMSVGNGSYAPFLKLISVFVTLSVIFGNIKAMTMISSSHEFYKKKTNVIIMAIIYNVVMVAFMISNFTLKFEVLDLFVLLGSVAAAALYVVDMFLEKKRVAAETPAVEEKQPEQKQEEEKK